MIYRQKRKANYSSKTQRTSRDNAQSSRDNVQSSRDNVQNSRDNAQSSRDRSPGSSKNTNDYHDNYRPDVMTVHSLGVSSNDLASNRWKNAHSYGARDSSAPNHPRGHFRHNNNQVLDGLPSSVEDSRQGARSRTAPFRQHKVRSGAVPLMDTEGKNPASRSKRFHTARHSSSRFLDSSSPSDSQENFFRKPQDSRSSKTKGVFPAGHAFRRSYIRRDKKAKVEVQEEEGVKLSFDSSEGHAESLNHGSDAETNTNHSRLFSSFFSDVRLPQRLHKVLANAGVGSRRDMEQLIFEGAVSVNGKVAEIGQKVLSTDVIAIHGEVVAVNHSPSLPRLLLYYKPEGCIVSRDDPEGRPSVFDNLPELQEGRWVPIGRLDFNTSGLLLFTTSGDLANHLMHPRYEIEREYAVRINGILADDQRDLLLSGVSLDDGTACFRSVIDAHPPGTSDGEAYNHWYHVVLAEGRNREVRRIFESLGIQVTRLIRIRYGGLRLPEDLRRGHTWELPSSSVEEFLMRLERQVVQLEKKREGCYVVQKRRWLMRRRVESSVK